MSEKLLTVEETAARLGISTATVKRRAREGTLDAVKNGRNWVIRAAGLPSPVVPRTPRATGAPSGLVDFNSALRHLRDRDLQRDLWIPDVLRFEDDLNDVSWLTDAAAARIDGLAELDPAVPVPVPKSPIFLRNAVNLSLPDRLAYHAVVLAMAPALDAAVGTQAFAARLGNSRRFLKSDGAYARWKAAVKKKAEEVDGYVVETDVTAYFDCISHTVLMQEVRAVGVPAPLADVLGRMLRTWGVAPGTGLPQGPDASRLLGNFYMKAVDDVMARIPGVSYFRYMDDVRIIAPSRHLAIRALHQFDDECKQRGLVLSTKKTELRTASAALAALQDSALDDAQYEFNHDESSAKSRRTLSDLFRAAINDDGTVNSRRARFSLYRLRALREKSVLSKVLSNLETVSGLGWNVAAYLAPWLTRPRVGDRIADYLEDPERNTADFLSSWLLAAIADEPRSARPRLVNFARSRAFDRSQPSSQRAIAMQVTALGRQSSDLARLKAVVDREYDPGVVRGALVALRRVDRLDRTTADRAKRLPGMERTIQYLRAHDDLPSMLFGGQRAQRLHG
ncbi:excisionase family DNA binding protein [Microbacterium sp. AG1240]|uniref:reverse transcriptase domain-containing protein n=1 Tax=Microbacterium sp. AG1240 TaxID=2183992 RepID=UPI000EAC8C48|nr:reverse transcriptase domain-containing protein [Microbacterium sp. AG1240]RKT31446.1 excisionase family DNA binding protein [Microbacterium sp. AG1240]